MYPNGFILLVKFTNYLLLHKQSFHFVGDYRQFEVADKRTDRARFMHGFFSGRTYDTRSTVADPRGRLIGDSRDTHYGVLLALDGFRDQDGRWSRIIRQLKNTHRNGMRTVELNDVEQESRNHSFRLHRFTHMLAFDYGITIFNDGMLEAIGLDAPAAGYEAHVAYRPPGGMMMHSIRKQIRVDRRRHSLRCDVDHRLGYLFAYCNGLAHCQATSHRMNTCFSYVRRKSGHWCFGLVLSRYTDGQTTNPIDTRFVDRISWEGGVVTFDREPIVGLDPFTVLPVVDNNWLSRVDCYCNEMRGVNRCHVCRCTCTDEEDELCPLCQEFENLTA